MARGVRPNCRRADNFMPVRDSEAIVLRTYPLGDADRLVSVLTRSFGRLKGVAKGARKPRSAFGGSLEPLSHLRLWFHENETRELVRFNQCELIESFLDVQQDYAAGIGLALLAEVSEAVLPERESSDAAFRLLLLAARTIKQTREPALPIAYFCLWTVKLAGWLPDLTRCVKCGREASSEILHAAAEYPGLACARCKRPGMTAIPAPALAMARRMLAENLDRLAAERPLPNPGREFLEYLLDMIEHNSERKLHTRQLLEAKA
jgi:DNA repair protein RecO (recombination protein O)